MWLFLINSINHVFEGFKRGLHLYEKTISKRINITINTNTYVDVCVDSEEITWYQRYRRFY